MLCVACASLPLILKDLIHAPPQKAGLRVCETASQRGRVVLVEDCGACIRRCTLAVRDIAGVEVSMLFWGRGDIHKHCDVREAQLPHGAMPTQSEADS